MRLLTTFIIAAALSLLGSPPKPALAQVNQGQGAKNASINQGGAFGFVHRTPWFSHPQMRTQLELNEDQFNKLNQAYTQSWSRYNQGLTGLDKSLAENERMQQHQELTGTFNKDFSKSVESVFADKQARQRYNQMDWQYRGYGAFNDPMVQQQLKLNGEQRQKFTKYNNEWNDQMNNWRREFQNDRDGMANKFSNARKEWQSRIDSVLTPEQRTTWKDMSGKPFDFPVDVYFQNSDTLNTSVKPDVK